MRHYIIMELLSVHDSQLSIQGKSPSVQQQQWRTFLCRIGLRVSVHVWSKITVYYSLPLNKTVQQNF